jgi:hypothetical protein
VNTLRPITTTARALKVRALLSRMTAQHERLVYLTVLVPTPQTKGNITRVRNALKRNAKTLVGTLNRPLY